ncbi:adenylate cyclase [Rhodococcus sp. NPDC049939]|uniref:adenylate cyclase n=1 Tax=Rhodococcus sp. NPDC049939 TaxID=3155511 RepID=UPI0034064C2D
MDWTAIGVGLGYVVTVLAILVPVVGVCALFVYSIKPDFVEETSEKSGSRRKQVDETR